MDAIPYPEQALLRGGGWGNLSIIKKNHPKVAFVLLAEGAGFEPAVGY